MFYAIVHVMDTNGAFLATVECSSPQSLDSTRERMLSLDYVGSVTVEYPDPSEYLSDAQIDSMIRLGLARTYHAPMSGGILPLSGSIPLPLYNALRALASRVWHREVGYGE